MNIVGDNNSNENIFSNEDQIYEFYETLRNTSGDAVDQFQSLLETFVADIFKHRKEIKRLEDAYKRDRETNEKFLRDIEVEQEHDMRQLEEKIRQEERQKADLERELLQQRTSKEIKELQANLQRLRTIEQHHNDRKNNEDSSVATLRDELAKLAEENQALNSSLNDSLTSNAILESNLQSFRVQLGERISKDNQPPSAANDRDRESLQTNVRHLIEVNKQLRDENDALRATIETNKANNNKPTYSLLSPKRLFSRAGSTLDAYWNDAKKEAVSPSFLNPPRFGSIDLGSEYEIGNSFRPAEVIDTYVRPNKMPMLVTSKLTAIPSDNNATNDSGLSLTTARDVTEVDTDVEFRTKNELALKNLNKNRVSQNQKYNDETTDNDDVFPEPVSFNRNADKRASHRRKLKKETSLQSSKFSPSLSGSPAVRRANETSTAGMQTDRQLDRIFKVVFCGDAAVGKTTLIQRICKGKFISSISTTLNVDFQNKEIELEGKRVALQLWDTAGQERFRSIAKSYFRRCDGVILVYDATYEHSFLNVREWVTIITDSISKKVSIMIVANKIDLRDQARAEGKRVVELSEGLKLAEEHKALFFETSAKDGTNTNEALIELARDMQENEDLERRLGTTGIDLDKRPVKKSTCCGN